MGCHFHNYKWVRPIGEGLGHETITARSLLSFLQEDTSMQVTLKQDLDNVAQQLDRALKPHLSDGCSCVKSIMSKLSRIRHKIQHMEKEQDFTELHLKVRRVTHSSTSVSDSLLLLRIEELWSDIECLEKKEIMFNEKTQKAKYPTEHGHEQDVWHTYCDYKLLFCKHMLVETKTQLMRAIAELNENAATSSAPLSISVAPTPYPVDIKQLAECVGDNLHVTETDVPCTKRTRNETLGFEHPRHNSHTNVPHFSIHLQKATLHHKSTRRRSRGSLPRPPIHHDTSIRRTVI